MGERIVLFAALAVGFALVRFGLHSSPDAFADSHGDVIELPSEAKPIAGMPRAEGDGRQQGRSASNARKQREPRTGPLGRRY